MIKIKVHQMHESNEITEAVMYLANIKRQVKDAAHTEILKDILLSSNGWLMKKKYLTSA